MSLPRVRKSSVHCKYSSRNVADRDIEKKGGKKGGRSLLPFLLYLHPRAPNGRKGEKEASPSPPGQGKKSSASYFFPITTRPFLRVKHVLV